MVDWLSVSMFGPWHTLTMKPGETVAYDVPNVRPGLALVKQADAPKGWRDRYYLVDRKGAKLVTVLASPENAERHPRDYMQAQFDNSTLASGEWRELHRALMVTGSTHAGVLRLDISADGWVNADGTIGGGGDFIPVVQSQLLGITKYFGKSKWGTYHEKNYFNGFAFGKKSSGKFIRCYYKKEEMAVKGHKAHIENAWKQANAGADVMADPREVGRMEIQLKGAELRRYWKGESDPDALHTLHDPTRRVSLFSATTRTMWDFRTWPTDGRARSAHPVTTWDWSLCTTNALENFNRDQRTRKMTDHRAKSALGFLHELYRVTGDQDLLLLRDRAAKALGEQYVDYCHRKERTWDAVGDAVEFGSGKRPGTDDVFTRSFWRNLRDAHSADERDRLRTFADGSCHERSAGC